MGGVCGTLSGESMTLCKVFCSNTSPPVIRYLWFVYALQGQSMSNLVVILLFYGPALTMPAIGWLHAKSCTYLTPSHLGHDAYIHSTPGLRGRGLPRASEFT